MDRQVIKVDHLWINELFNIHTCWRETKHVWRFPIMCVNKNRIFDVFFE